MTPAAIILAAGIGRRLGEAKPKIMLEFAGRSLLERHIAALDANGIGDVAITVGHGADLIRAALARLGLEERVRLIENPRYREGSIVSLWMQRRRLASGRPVLLMDGDVLYEPRMIGRLLAAKAENALLLDRAIAPGDEPVKICLREGHIVDFAKLPQHPHDWRGESVGFFRFSPAMAASLAARTVDYVQAGRLEEEYEPAIRDLILQHPERFGYEDISDLAWTEIDFAADVERAQSEILPRLEAVLHA